MNSYSFIWQFMPHVYVNWVYDLSIVSLNENIDSIISWQHLKTSNLISFPFNISLS
jgi:hypothetical protein